MMRWGWSHSAQHHGIPQNARDQAIDTLRILTLNVHKGFGYFNRRFVLPELRDAVRILSADVVFLQEVLGVNTEHPERHRNWPPQPQYEFLADSLWPDFAYGKNADYPEGDHGNALLSKFPIAQTHNFDISAEGRERRGLLHCRLNGPDGQALHVICVHLDLAEAHRQRQLQQLCSFIADSVPAHAPLLVAGDFNDWRVRANDVLRRGAGLQEAFSTLQGRSARSFPARWPLLRLDRVYFRNLRLVQAQLCRRRPWSHLSDHLPLLVEFAL